jgi:hypothetical protein
MKHLNKLGTSLLLLLLVVSCKSDPSETEAATSETLTGNWLLVSALMNEQPTERLYDIYFNVTEDSLITNFPAPDFPMNESLSYTLSDNKITNLPNTTLTFDIERLSQDTLVINTDLRGITVKMTFERAADGEVIDSTTAPSSQAAE